jgi:molecular chaperone GrpE
MSASNLSPAEPAEVRNGAAQDPGPGPAQEADATAPAPEPDRVTQLEQEVASLKDQLLRRRAEFDNYRRRTERDHRVAAEDAVIGLLSDLLPSLDALEKALAAQGTLQEIRSGVEITLKDVSTILANRGVRSEDPTGEKFEPLRHQALSYEPAAGAEDGTNVTCYRKGYLLGERLIRPALVKVAQKAADEPSSEPMPVSH